MKTNEILDALLRFELKKIPKLDLCMVYFIELNPPVGPGK